MSNVAHGVKTTHARGAQKAKPARTTHAVENHALGAAVTGEARTRSHHLQEKAHVVHASFVSSVLCNIVTTSEQGEAMDSERGVTMDDRHSGT